jgi:hypothetical protein
MELYGALMEICKQVVVVVVVDRVHREELNCAVKVSERKPLFGTYRDCRTTLSTQLSLFISCLMRPQS